MKYSYATFGMIVIGLFAFAIVWVFQMVTVNNEGDYYSLKEAMEASMYESIDWVYYATGGLGDDGEPLIQNVPTGCHGQIRIIEEKFVSNFTRRFVKNTMGSSNGYTIQIYDVMEFPPKASVRILNKTASMSLNDSDFTVVNELSGILMSKSNSGVNSLYGICS